MKITGIHKSDCYKKLVWWRKFLTGTAKKYRGIFFLLPHIVLTL